MKDYYKILGVNRNASQNKIFRRFRNQMLRFEKGSNNIQDLITSYLTLQEKPRKFYNLLLDQAESKITLNEKYLKILKSIEAKAENLSEKFEEEPNFLLTPLTKNAAVELLGSTLGSLTGTDLSTPASLGIGLLLVSIILSVIGFSRLDSKYFIISFVLFVLGILLYRKGITEWRIENFEKVTIHNT